MRFDGRDFLVFDKCDGLTDGFITSFSFRNCAWMGTNNGLICFDSFIASGSQFQAGIRWENGLTNQALAANFRPRFNSFGYKNGYPIKDMNTNAMFVTDSGRLWAGVSGTLLQVNLEKLNRKAPSNPTQIKGMLIAGNKMAWKTLDRARKSALPEDSLVVLNEQVMLFGTPMSRDERLDYATTYNTIQFTGLENETGLPHRLVLPCKFNDIQFNFGTTELSRPELVRYSFMLEGFDKRWSPASHIASANYGNLPDGTYIFKVKAMNPDGTWRQEAAYAFSVMPPWYFTRWAYLFFAIISVAIVYIVVSLRIRQLNNDKKQLEHLVVERTSEISRLLDSQEEIIKERTSQLKEANQALLETISYSAHEVREPATRILGAVISRDLFTKEEFNETIVPEIERAAKELDERIKGLVKIANNGLK